RRRRRRRRRRPRPIRPQRWTGPARPPPRPATGARVRGGRARRVRRARPHPTWGRPRPGRRRPTSRRRLRLAPATALDTPAGTLGPTPRCLEPRDHEEVLVRRGRRSGLFTFVAVHSTVRG